MGYDEQYIEKKMDDRTSYLYTLYKKLELLSPQKIIKNQRKTKSPDPLWNKSNSNKQYKINFKK